MMNDNPNNGGCVGCLLWAAMWVIILTVVGVVVQSCGWIGW